MKEQIKSGKLIINTANALYLFLSLLFLRVIFVDTVGTIFGFLGIPTSLVSITYYLAMWICLVLSIFHIISRSFTNIRLVGFIAMSAVIMFCSVLLYPASLEYIYETLLEDIPAFQATCLLSSVLFVFIGAAIDNFDRLFVYLMKAAKIGLILATVRTVYKFFVINSYAYDDMVFAYELCVLVCIAFIEYMSKKSKGSLAFFIVGAVILLASGTRGPIVAVLSFVLIVYITQGNSKKKTIVLSSILLFVGVCYWLGFIHSIAVALSNALKELNMNLRIVDMFLEGSISDDSGRKMLQEEVFSAIREHPLIGNGIGMDQKNFLYYTHNIIIELIYDFGIPLGVFFIAWILVKTFKSVRYGSKSYGSMVLLLFCTAFVKLLFSQTYIYSSSFFIFIGVLLGQKSMKKKTSETERYIGEFK